MSICIQITRARSPKHQIYNSDYQISNATKYSLNIQLDKKEFCSFVYRTYTRKVNGFSSIILLYLMIVLIVWLIQFLVALFVGFILYFVLIFLQIYFKVIDTSDSNNNTAWLMQCHQRYDIKTKQTNLSHDVELNLTDLV